MITEKIAYENYLETVLKRHKQKKEWELTSLQDTSQNIQDKMHKESEWIQGAYQVITLSLEKYWNKSLKRISSYTHRFSEAFLKWHFFGS